MFFLLWRRASRYYPLLALLATHLVISMPAPPAKRSPEEASGGFSNVPKILEIQLPLKIASKDDLVAWAKYVMGLMASKINITLTTVKESAPKISGNIRSPETVEQSQNSKASVFRSMGGARQPGNIRTFAVSKNFENPRYAENVRNLGGGRNYERAQNPGAVRPSGNNNRHSENLRIPQRNMNLPLPKEILIATTNTPTLRTSGLTTSSLLDNLQLHSSFANLGILQTTVQSPLEITANINIPRPRTKEQEFKNTFDVPSSLKLNNQRLFVPPIPDFGPVLNLNNDIFRNANTISTPSRAYLPVTTTDSLKFPTDPFATRYFFDGVERNLSGNLGVLPHDITFTTHRPLIFNDEIPLPVRSVEVASHRNSTGPLTPLFKLPFEAVITITRENSGEAVTERAEKDKYFVAPTRNPLVEFPPYFDTNYTVTNESGQINVVFDDGSQVTESLSDTRKGSRKNQEKKKDSSSKQRSKKQKTATQKPATQKPATQKTATKKTSPIAQFLKMFTALRRNSSLAMDLTPPPLRPQTFQTPFGTQVSTERPVSSLPGRSSFRQGRRNETSQKQEFEDDDDEDNDNGSENDSAENDSGENDSGENDSNGDDDVESNEGGNSKASDESSSSESDSDYDDDDDDEGGSIKAIIGLLQLVGPILEDLSDPESDTDIAEVVEAAVPILQDLSEGDGETEGLDIPGILVPVLLQLSGGPEGQRDSAAILRPILQLSAPLIGPLVGPLIVPLSHQSSQPPGSGGSNVKDLIQSISSPLSQITGPGKMSMLTKLIAGVVSSLSKSSNTYGKGKSDITSLVKAVVAGSVAGTSAGSSGAKDSYAAPTSYGNDHGGGGGDSYYSPNCQGGRC
ncbi:uncharacterized protein LOC143373184 [Andrena cerasifolii]|uniref:uncharacterized protein LOC143373184 n=1 Tax=Andrena cerasifolii TaxID=2819439 RepID=UPI004037A7C4